MLAVLDLYRGLLRLVGKLERMLGVACIAVMVSTITTQVFTRYVLSRPIIWVEELATYSFIWGAFLGASLGLKHGRHVRIETFVDHLPERARSALRLLVNLVILAVLWHLVREVGKVINIESRSSSVSLPWPVPRAWFYSIPLAVSCVSMTATCAYFALVETCGLLGVSGAGQRRHVMGAPPPAGVQT
ncbi:MAG TPA: TRAP transporter small permease [Hyphomicrobiaceae bacterium]|nr:TRAP transporter small permease [Hyphomicrobiaceae bacterium]